jgi:Protein of unknown function (DUF1569)
MEGEGKKATRKVQMLHHLNLACGGSLGFYNLPDESYRTSRTFFKWILVDWFPEQPVGLRLPAGFKIPHSQRFEFAYEKAQLLKILEADWNARTADAWKPHPMFGKMTTKEWGKLLLIHVDYHLRQFAVSGLHSTQRPYRTGARRSIQSGEGKPTDDEV